LTGEKQTRKKTVRFAPEVVDPLTDKKNYLKEHRMAWAALQKLGKEEISSSDTAAPLPPLEFVENFSVTAVESMKKEDTDQLRLCIALSTGICNFILT
jgi:hypothetical protein